MTRKLVWADEDNCKGPKCTNCGWTAKSLSEVYTEGKLTSGLGVNI